MKKKSQEVEAELAVSGFDLILGVTGMISPVSTLNSLKKVIDQRRAERTVRNLKAFLKEANKATPDQKKNFKKKTIENNKEFYERLLVALEELDEEKKAELLGKFQLALFEDKLHTQEFMKLAKILELIDAETLNFFLSKDSGSFPSRPSRQIDVQYFNELIGLGLAVSELEIKNDEMNARLTGRAKLVVIQKFKFTPLGDLLLDLYNYNVRKAGYKERMQGREQKRK